jgi:uncharacterized SAM-binding protein YcdF (DUF218 family)
MCAVFLPLSKLLDWFLAPLSWALLLLGLAALARGRPRLRAVLAVLAVAVLAAFSSEPVASRLERWSERDARATFRPDVVYDAIIVLGGMVDEKASQASGEVEVDGHVERLLRAWELLRAGRAQAVLLSGGVVDPDPGDVAEADRLAALLVRWGVPPAQIVTDASARNTRENAAESGRIAAARGWKTLLLVTSAAHMPRAVGCFRAVGIEPDVLPVDHRATKVGGGPWLPRVNALARSTDVLHELFGRLVYRAMGYAR